MLVHFYGVAICSNIYIYTFGRVWAENEHFLIITEYWPMTISRSKSFFFDNEKLLFFLFFPFSFPHSSTFDMGQIVFFSCSLNFDLCLRFAFHLWHFSSKLELFKFSIFAICISSIFRWIRNIQTYLIS